jgi:tetratricopeptide (TPR) repeat protein
MSDYLDKIELYLAGKLDDRAAQAFEEEMRSDHTLAEEVEQYQMIHHALEFSVENQLREHLAEQSRKHWPVVRTRMLWPRYMAIAASLLMLVSLGYFLFDANDRSSAMADNQYIHFESVENRGEALVYDLDEGFKLIEEGKIDEAIQYFQNIVSANAENHTAHFILGDLYTRQEKYELARNEMQIIIQDQSFRWLEKAQLNYLILSLKLDWNDDSDLILKTILADSRHPFYQEAKQIQQQIR